MTKPPAPGRDPWADRRRRELLVWASLVGSILVAAPLAYLTASLTSREWPYLVITFGWASLVAVALFRLGTFPCPGCGKAFAWTWYWQNVFTSRCLHCGLRKGRRPEPGPSRPS